MSYKDLVELVRDYKLKNQSNYYDKLLCEDFIRFVFKNGDSSFDKNNLTGHVTAGGIVVCENFVLLNHHKKLNLWIGFGGHAEVGETDPFLLACREVFEETGLEGLKSNGKILDIEKFTFKHGTEPAHTHYDVRYLIVAKNKNAVLNTNESQEFKWLTIDHAIAFSQDYATKKILGKYKRLYETKHKNTPIVELVK